MTTIACIGIIAVCVMFLRRTSPGAVAATRRAIARERRARSADIRPALARGTGRP